MASWSMRDKACIVGVGTTAYGSFPDTDAYGLGMQALNAALADCGLSYPAIDGLIVNRLSYERFLQIANLRTRFMLATEAHGRFSAVSVMLAAEALAAGSVDVVALVYANNGRSAGARYGGGDGIWAPWGFTSPGATHAMMFQTHMAQYGTKSEDLSHIAVAFRKHAMLNPAAVMRKPMTLDDHRASRFIAEPLRLLDYCLINDGAVALIMTTPERAADLRKPPVYVSGYARQDDVTSATPATDYYYPALARVSEQVYDRAGLGRSDIDGLMIYDNFTPTVLFSLEGMGFCKPGEGGDFIKDGTLELGRGRWPTNTSGGHLSESYMQGWALLAESVRQLRAEGSDRQIRNCHAVQCICATNVCSSIIMRN